MWNIDIETRIRDLNATAEDRQRQVRLLDTMTETDGSANTGRIALARIVERFKRVFGHPIGGSAAHASRPASVASGR
jgi:hypothetical protein